MWFNPVFSLLKDAESYGSRPESYRALNGYTAQGTPLTVGSFDSMRVASINSRKDGGSAAFGAYQFVGSKRVFETILGSVGLTLSTFASPANQDLLCMAWLCDATRYRFFGNVVRSTDRAVSDLSRVWAGIPRRNGQSTYDGVGNNSARVTYQRASDAIVSIRTRVVDLDQGVKWFSESTVYRLQLRLLGLGHNVKADGLYGPQTLSHLLMCGFDAAKLDTWLKPFPVWYNS